MKSPQQFIEEFAEKFPYQLIARSFSAIKDFDPNDIHFDRSEDIKHLIITQNITQLKELRGEVVDKIITKKNAEELAHTPLCRENPEKANNHFFCSITNPDYFRNQSINHTLSLIDKKIKEWEGLLTNK